MKKVNAKLQSLREDVIEIAEYCEQLGDEKTRQLLLEIDELLEVTHLTFMGNTDKRITVDYRLKNQKH